MLAGSRPVHLVDGEFPLLLRYHIRQDRDELPFRAFLGQPLIVYGHHDDLAKGPAILAETAAFIRDLGPVRVVVARPDSQVEVFLTSRGVVPRRATADATGRRHGESRALTRSRSTCKTVTPAVPSSSRAVASRSADRVPTLSPTARSRSPFAIHPMSRRRLPTPSSPIRPGPCCVVHLPRRAID